MIKDSIDFEYAINKMTTYIEPTIKLQGEYLNSERMNETFKSIEENLNTLYEKTRFLEDSIQYTKFFLDSKIKSFNEEMESITQELESTLDMTKNLSYVSYNVPLKQNELDINDRAESLGKISPLISKDKKLTIGYDSNIDIDISSVYTISDSVAFSDTIESTPSTKTYKAIFLEEKIIKDGLRETMIVYFLQPVKINVLDFVASNCSIKNIRFGLVNGIEEHADDYDISKNNVSRMCIYIKFDMVCTNYNTVIYEIDKDKMPTNLWDNIREYETARVSNLDKISKLNAEYILSRTTINKATREHDKVNYQSSVNKNIYTLKMYSYIFGMDRINFKKVDFKTDGYFISEPIHIGKLTSVDSVSLDVKDVRDKNCIIEYSILDGDIEIPLLPIGEDIIENEPILVDSELRFIKDDTAEEIIKRNGQLIEQSYNEAINKNDGIYTITYKPKVDYHSINYILNDSVRVKCYMRTFGTDINTVSYIEAITLRKYGEAALWERRY